MVNLHQLLKAMIEQGASDLHITIGTAPQLRIDGRLIPLKVPALTPADTKQICYSVLTEAQKHKFEEEHELDLSFGVKSLARFRANMFLQRGAIAAAFRVIPLKLPTFQELGLPAVVNELVAKPRGLILITGPTGAGKSTTLASIVDRINNERHEHILTIEDPIEYLHTHKGCVVNQREVGADTESFRKALRYVLRQDPDVVLIGEMRDLETIEAALTIAETGHLAFGTLHTNSAIQTVNRLIDVFPPYQQTQIRSKVSFTLEGVISQLLLPRATGKGRALALEIMVPTPAIRNLIREDKIHQIYSTMQIGQEKHGMVTLNQSLLSLVQRRQVTVDEAMGRASDLEEFRNMLTKAGISLKMTDQRAASGMGGMRSGSPW